MSLVSLPSYPTTSFHTTPEYLDFLREEQPQTSLRRSSSSSSNITLRMSYPLQTNNNSPRHIQQAQEDDGHPDDDGLEYVNSRIRGLEAFASPEARNKVLPWLDEVPRGGKPEDERSFAGGSMRTAGGILKPARKPLPPSVQSSPPIVPLPTTPLRTNIGSPIVLPSLPYQRRDESVSAAELQHQLDGTATDVSRAEREERKAEELEEERRAGRGPASGDVPSPFIPLKKDVSKHHHSSRTNQDQPSTNSNDPDRSARSPQFQQHERLHNISRASHRPPIESPSTDPRTSTSSFGNVDNPDKVPRRLTLPVKRAPSAAGTEVGSTVRRRWKETANQPPPDLPSRPTPSAGIRPERDNDSTRTALPSPPREHQSSVPTPAYLESGKQAHHHSQSQQLVRSNRAPSLSTHRHSADATRSAIARASLFHDKVLCELLEAAFNPSLGEEVKKVLKTAVEKRVGELAREVLRQEVDGRGLDSLRQQQLQEAPPPWAVDLLAKLEANNTRIETILRSLHHSTSSPSTPANHNSSYPPPDAYIVPLSPVSPSQDIPETSTSPTRSPQAPLARHPLGTSLGLFTESPTTFDPSTARHNFGDPTSAARALYVEVDPSTFHPVGPPGIFVGLPSPNPQRPVSSQRAQTRTFLLSSTSTPPVPTAPRILVQAPSTNRSRTPARVAAPFVDQPVLPEAQEIITRDFAERDLPQIPPPEVAESDSSAAGVFAFKPPPVLEDEGGREERRGGERGEEVTRKREKEDFGENPILPRLMDPRPWDLVTQRLYAWAVIWSMDDFTRALEEISLARQVNSFALTIWATTTYKRQLRHKICSNPSEIVDKMFVPPNLGDSLNQACYHKRFNDAKMIIEELWTPFGLPSLCPTGFPRVILAICRHRNEDDTWAVHRFDLASSSMRTFLFYAGDRKRLLDGRPFSWWHAIRAAWPNAGIKDPDGGDMAQKTDHIQLPLAEGGDVSLEAVNCFRNLLMGWRWDRPTEIYKLRELVWIETKRLMSRKAEGRLIMDLTADTGRVSNI